MRNKYFPIFAICLTQLFALPLAHAQDDQQQAPADDKQAFVLTPLAIGNTWVYENKADGVVITEQIAGVVLFDNKPWYLLRSAERPIDEPDAQPTYVWESWLAHLNGVDMLALAQIDEHTGTLKLDEPSGDYRYPVAKGDTYRPIEKNRFTTMEVLDIDVTIKTRAGEFKCIAYLEHNADEEDVKITTYLAPGVGIVRISTQIDGETTNVDLIKYTLVEGR